MNFEVVNESGKWVRSLSPFPLWDPEKSLRFKPGVATKVDVPKGSWLAGQIAAGAFAFAEGPEGPEAKAPEAEGKPQGPPNQTIKVGLGGSTKQ